MIMLSGDFHGNCLGELSAINHSNVKGKCPTPELIKWHIILGDCGFMFGGRSQEVDKTDKYLQTWFNDRKYTTLCVFGNHENYEKLLSLPKVDIGIGEDVYKVTDKIYYLQRGKVYTIEDKKILVLGGGDSIDKDQRIPGLSWWKEEQWSYKETEDFFKYIENITEVDYVVSHTTTDEFLNEIMKQFSHFYKLKDDTVTINNEVNKRIKFKHWYCGHYHITLENEKYTCLYKDLRFI